MYLSRLTLNLAHEQARLDLSDPYEQHRTLMRLADDGAGKLLWRLDDGDSPVLLVQSENEPQLSNFKRQLPRYTSNAETRPNQLLSNLRDGDEVHFRLRANPTVKRLGKRHGLVKPEDQIEWLQRSLAANGAEVVSTQVVGTKRLIAGRKRRGRRIILTAVTFDGQLRIQEAAAFRQRVTEGIGHGRAFGCGLITIAR